MTTYGPPDATCTVRTYKAGLLSAVGHDLEFRVTKFSIEADESGIHATFDGGSLEVVGALRDGRADPSALSAKDVRDILDNVRKTVFAKHQPARIRFDADDVDVTGDSVSGEGELTIPPFTHSVRFEAHVQRGRAVCEVKLHQPDWGITPFSAAMGTLRVRPDVIVRIEIPWEG